MTKKSVGTAGKFGPRYGMRGRKKWLETDKKQRASYQCPACKTKSVKRVSSGIWICRKCCVKFAGGAYVPSTEIMKGVEIVKDITEGNENV